ncbi:MAG: hypothetical protein AAF666_12250, partial [Pseudomonadota bacterium]
MNALFLRCHQTREIAFAVNAPADGARILDRPADGMIDDIAAQFQQKTIRSFAIGREVELLKVEGSARDFQILKKWISSRNVQLEVIYSSVYEEFW